MDRADSLQARLDFSRAVDDSMALEIGKRDIKIEALEQNQRRWYDEPVIIGKVLALALAVKWLTGG